MGDSEQTTLEHWRLPSIGGLSPKKKKDTYHHDKLSIITPSIIENTFGSTIGARTTALPTFRELGPPDLVHVSRYNKHSQKEEGEYHYITGLDVSSEIAPIAYLATLNLQRPTTSSKHPNIFTYCSYSPLSKCDVRIRAELAADNSSSVSLQLIPSDRSNKVVNEISEQVWEELFVSSIVRSVMTSLDFERKLPGLNEQPLIQSSTHAKEILQMLVKYLHNGHVFGCDTLTQKPSVVQNFLVDTILKLVELTDLYDYVLQLLKETNRTDISLIVVKILFLQDREIDAVKLLHQGINANARDTFLLNEQAKFLMSKENYTLALKSAVAATNSNPIEFEAWYNLSKLYILNGDIQLSLLALNSCPMYGVRLKDLVLIGQNDLIKLPLPNEGKIKSIWDNLTQVFGYESENLLKFTQKFEVEAVDPALIRINSQPLKGTYKKAYDLLILIISKIGWDGLLKARSDVFIMDDEYRNMSTATLSSQAKSIDLKSKRLCERWLDSLFLVLYEDLRVSLIVENELENQKQLKHSSLEWELIGLTSYRTHHFKNAIASLRTTINAKYDVISAYKLLELYEKQHFDKEFQIWNQSNPHGTIDISLDSIIDVLVKTVSYQVRFFDQFELAILLFLKKLLREYDAEYIKSKIQVLYTDETDSTNSGIVPPFDKLVNILNSVSQYDRDSS